MEITTKEVSGINVVYLRGDINSATSGQVMDSLVNLAQSGVKNILLNLKDVEFISSAGLRSILVASKLLKNADGELRICNTNELVAKVLETSGFTSLVRIHSDESTAIAAFKS
jgi:anti-anti-sigma factor